MEESIQELIRKDLEDIKRWLAEAPTPEIKKYRMQVILDAFSGKPLGNEEWDTSSTTAVEKTRDDTL